MTMTFDVFKHTDEISILIAGVGMDTAPVVINRTSGASTACRPTRTSGIPRAYHELWRRRRPFSSRAARQCLGRYVADRPRGSRGAAQLRGRRRGAECDGELARAEARPGATARAEADAGAPGTEGARMTEQLRLTLRPHLERDGFHTERFDAYLGDELICTNRSGWHTPAVRC
jgi:hypothetical protein